MLNCCQLMMAPGLLVTVSALPACTNVAWPCTTCGNWGLANKEPVALTVSKASRG